jgi:hypothetical protein
MLIFSEPLRLFIFGSPLLNLRFDSHFAFRISLFARFSFFVFAFSFFASLFSFFRSSFSAFRFVVSYVFAFRSSLFRRDALS